MPDLENIELIVFDIDGTLAETDDYYINKITVHVRKILPFVEAESLEKTIRPVVMFFETVFQYIYKFLDKISLDKLISAFHNKITVGEDYRYDQVEGMQKTIEILSEHYKLGILTSGGRKSTVAFLKKFELESSITYVVSAEDCKHIKPHPKALLAIAEKAGVPIEHCLMVGDTVFDILCAKSAGAVSAAVRTGFDSTAYLKKSRSDLLLESVNDLPALLLKRN